MKKNKKRLLAVMVGAALTISALPAYALSFSDVDGNTAVDWAKPAINRMTEKGYIKGYEDGTFKPNNSINKIESLIMMSRMLGREENDWAESVELAEKTYGTKLNAFKTPYKTEVAFLMYQGMLTDADLNTYVSESNSIAPLKRYEAAILLTKLMGAAEEVANQLLVSSSYSDSMQIPSDARAYVEYVRTAGIMQGMGNDAAGKPVFSPNTEVTRAQMAQILANLIDTLNRKTTTGVIASLDSFNDKLAVTVDNLDINYELADTTIIRKDGQDADLSDLETGKTVRVTHMQGKVRLLEEITIKPEETVNGIVVSASTDKGVRKITIQFGRTQQTYTLADKCEVRIKSTLGDFSNVKAKDYVTLTLKNDKVIKVETKDEITEASGLVHSIDADEETVVLNLEDLKGNVTSYDVPDSGVSITRNGNAATIRDLAQGDKVTLRLKQGLVTKIQASSTNTVLEGVIEAVVLSDDPKITVRVDGESKTYGIYNEVRITLDNEDGSLYDLRPKTPIRFTLESNEIKSITATSVASKTQVAGEIKAINSKYYMITVTDDDGQEESVFVNSSTKYFNEKNNAIEFKELKKGQNILVTGSNSSGVFEARIIIIQ